jgi:hypothetical protein
MAFFDRRNCNLPKCQVGFIQFFVLPLYEEVAKVFPAAQGPLVQTVQNKNQWVKQQEQELLKEAEDEESDDKDDSPDEDGAVTVEDIDTHVNKQ